MWLAEVLSCMRGEPLQLKNNPNTEWCFDPHAIVSCLVVCSQILDELQIRFPFNLTTLIAVYTHSGTCSMLLSSEMSNQIASYLV